MVTIGEFTNQVKLIMYMTYWKNLAKASVTSGIDLSAADVMEWLFTLCALTNRRIELLYSSSLTWKKAMVFDLNSK